MLTLRNQLPKPTTKLLINCIDRLGDNDELEIQIPSHQPLIIRRGRTVKTLKGNGYLLQIGTVFDYQARLFDQKFEFLIVEKSAKNAKRRKIWAFVASLTDQLHEVTEQAIVIYENNIQDVFPALQKNLTLEATTWMLEIETAGYLTGGEPH